MNGPAVGTFTPLLMLASNVCPDVCMQHRPSFLPSFLPHGLITFYCYGEGGVNREMGEGGGGKGAHALGFHNFSRLLFRANLDSQRESFT